MFVPVQSQDMDFHCHMSWSSCVLYFEVTGVFFKLVEILSITVFIIMKDKAD